MSNIEPTLECIKGFTVEGLSVRTINIEEFNPQTAKLPGLWTRFFSQEITGKIAHQIPDSAIYGVYSDYESDATGFYTVTAGVAVQSPLKDSEFNTVTVHDGYYLIFSGKGRMPQAVIDTWKNIWTYFATHPNYTRNYLSDFEQYNGPEEIAIYIGIQKPAKL